MLRGGGEDVGVRRGRSSVRYFPALALKTADLCAHSRPLNFLARVSPTRGSDVLTQVIDSNTFTSVFALAIRVEIISLLLKGPVQCCLLSFPQECQDASLPIRADEFECITFLTVNFTHVHFTGFKWGPISRLLGDT